MATSKRKQKIARREKYEAKQIGLIIGIATIVLIILLFIVFQKS
jgi:hypothetical protein